MVPPQRSRRINGHSPPPKHFFKIVIEDNIREGKLRIPPRFVRHNGNMLSSPVFLKVPTGKVWEVELTKRDGKIWLENGLKEFAEHYSLKNGYFLVFRYEGSSGFQVLIFNRTATEIKYSHANDNEENQQQQQQEVKIEQSGEEDDTVEIMDDIPTSSREKPRLQRGRPSKMMRTSPSVKTESGSMFNSAERFECDNGSSVRQRMGKGKSSAICSLRQLSCDKKSIVLGFQKAGLNSNNPYFVVAMHPTHVGIGNLFIPADFSRKYLKDHGDAILCNSDGDSWSATYYSSLGSTTGLQYVHLSWTTFVRDNKLKVGHTCAFELTNCNEISFKVFIDRGDDQEAAFQGSRASTSIQAACAFKSENPFCIVNLQPSSIDKHALSIPDEFARTYFPKTLRTADVKLCMNGKSWPAEYHQKILGKPNALICNGWREFFQDNNLQDGDVCVLEMTNENYKTTFNVFIYHDDTEGANGNPSQGKFSEVIQRPMLQPSKQAPKRPIFKTVVRKSHLKEKRVDIPFKVFERHFKPSIQMLKLEVADRLWPVKIASYSPHRIAKLTSGWYEFARDNNLSEGDVCFFSLDTKRKDLLKVSISRHGH